MSGLFFTDNYDAKFEIWAKDSHVSGVATTWLTPRVYPLPRIINFPKFSSRKFSSYQEMNAWKHDLLMQFASNGGAKWTK